MKKSTIALLCITLTGAIVVAQRPSDEEFIKRFNSRKSDWITFCNNELPAVKEAALQEKSRLEKQLRSPELHGGKRQPIQRALEVQEQRLQEYRTTRKHLCKRNWDRAYSAVKGGG